MTEIDCAMGAVGDSGVTETERATGSIYSGDPRVHSISSHLVLSYHTMNYIVYLSNLLIPLILSRFRRSTPSRGSSRLDSIISSHPVRSLLEPELCFVTNYVCNAAKGTEEC